MKLFKKIILFVTLVMTACAEKKPEIDYSKLDPNLLFSEAKAEYDQQSYGNAAENFMKIYEEYPFSDIAQQALLMALKSNYAGLKFVDAETISNEFITLYPNSPNIEEVYYLRAVIYYDQIRVVRLDQANTVAAKEAIEEYLNRYPNGKFANDLNLKLDLVFEHFAGKEMEVGRYYLGQSDYIAAINRFKIVVEKYSRTSHVQEALYRLTECYYALGLVTEANEYASILGHNYPDNRWYQKAYNILKNK